jgi:hypothetical protein
MAYDGLDERRIGKEDPGERKAEEQEEAAHAGQFSTDWREGEGVNG